MKTEPRGMGETNYSSICLGIAWMGQDVFFPACIVNISLGGYKSGGPLFLLLDLFFLSSILASTRDRFPSPLLSWPASRLITLSPLLASVILSLRHSF